ncbi:MAG: 1-deoxy-D-xylulose-5-phosphate reductoisomerase [Saccharofermentanaceae bacterium]|jgi:1-deoxy-D-xylulose-5-phosphate reductoisomerase|nr:1-deoxy-D-xylulose-5-phosphate reductoisomerase [Clostridia bacterium]NLX68875.1 1-deoxy-D-xylulose-5-phosphate reductoisomerase [Clostridiaceae bacterium]HOO49386.1 1-deoxy-D-xylulose-5-phosphate reductoisomerase [Saccharofermentans sp.]HRV50055.1 1-deoxy-D-xylulose-5-phosphate reductoisomerase [Saccharofermentans sp.]HUM23898.1 1-deoxy-D-xylulose-5-phosphate reductoisomerase [Saccharofermentans sp.]
MKKICILGSTGSIGKQTLEVVRQNPDDFEVLGLTCSTNISLLFEQVKEFRPRVVAVEDETKAYSFKGMLRDANIKSVEVITGVGCNSVVSTLDDVSMVVAAIVGVAGLEPVIDAIKKGKDIALANKETLVAGGDVVMPLVRTNGCKLLPVDSEHSAIWQCLWGENKQNLDRILLTASGGPFRRYTREQLGEVTAEKALNHPTWNMGGKITIDSATMMNKGLEVIEASHLFGLDVDRIDVVVHPQSVIHSMIRLNDGSVLAQMGKPSMILPIMVALFYPERHDGFLPKFDPFCDACNLTFEKCDMEVFRLLQLAYEVGRVKGDMPAAMNAANEIAVRAFLEGRISFLDIEKVVYGTVYKFSSNSNLTVSLDGILEADRNARRIAEEIIRG